MIGRLKPLGREHKDAIRAYLSMIGGSAGRLVISLVYFIAVANTLSISDFGLFATASACGIMLSRLLAFGFVSPLYRIATVKTRLLGTYTAGFLAGLLASLPVIAIAAWGTYLAIFAGQATVLTFVLIMVAEILCWRIMEIVVIVCYGVNRFGAGSALVVVATSLKAVAALVFAWLGDPSLGAWAWCYLAANSTAAIVAVVFYYPRVRLRFKPALYLRRWVDAVSVAGAEVVFYVQSELDKVLVLGFGGPETAGIYAMIMRLVDLTALPVRSFLTLLTQRLMRSSDMLQSVKTRALLEAVVIGVSTAGLLAMALVLAIFPMALGNNVAQAAPLLILVLLVPAFRNMIEYHSELLYATGRTVVRSLVLVSLAGMKALLLVFLLTRQAEVEVWVELLNLLFFVLYVQSGLLTYMALGRTARKPV